MKNFNILADATINEALKMLNDCGEKCLLVIDNNHKLKGTLSDGDIRKAILNGKNINSSIKESYNRKPTYYTVGEFSNNDAKNIFIQRRFDIIPVVDNHGEIVDALTYDKVFGEKKQPKKLNITVIIMAGGKGTRLEPFTKVLPSCRPVVCSRYHCSSASRKCGRIGRARKWLNLAWPMPLSAVLSRLWMRWRFCSRMRCASR